MRVRTPMSRLVSTMKTGLGLDISRWVSSSGTTSNEQRKTNLISKQEKIWSLEHSSISKFGRLIRSSGRNGTLRGSPWRQTAISFTFPCSGGSNRTAISRHYHIQHQDTSLPQFDDFTQERQRELKEKQNQYQLELKTAGLPMQVKELPDDEKFSWSYEFDLVGEAAKLGIEKLYINATTDSWDDLDSLKNLYSTWQDLPKPKSLDVWDDDDHFGNLRVAGINPVLIRLCTEIPDKLGVTNEMLAPFLENMSLEDAIAKKRLFIVDLEIMEDVPTKESNFVVCAPIALFYRTNKNQLIPVAIQLYQKKGEDNPVFLSTDPRFTWILARMWFNNADSAYHQAITHLGFTHLLMEGISVVTHRNLSQSHPIFKLLAPHFLYLIAINTAAVSVLLEEEGIVDRLMGTGVKGAFHLIAKRLKTWRMDVDGTLPEELRSRRVDDPSVLPYYPYRDDGLLVYYAVKRYVERIVNLYYGSSQHLAGDWEIQAWAKELVVSRDEGGCGLKGVPGDGKFTTNDQLVLVLTSIICTCSMMHAAANFPQYDEYGFPPNYPLLMKGKPPKSKSRRKEEDVVASLPDKHKTLEIMLVTKLLSQRETQRLGHFEENFVFDPEAVDIVKQFRSELDEISEKIGKRNRQRDEPYEWLDPALIPNSISI